MKQTMWMNSGVLLETVPNPRRQFFQSTKYRRYRLLLPAAEPEVRTWVKTVSGRLRRRRLRFLHRRAPPNNWK